MGTGSGGGSGGGGGSGVGGGRGGGSGGIGGGYYAKNGKVFAKGMTPQEAREVVVKTLSSISQHAHQYFERQFGGPLVQAVYNDLFKLSGCLKSNNPTKAVLDAFQMDDGEGFLPNLAGALMAEHSKLERDSRIIDTVKRTLDEFLLEAVDNDADAFLADDCGQAVNRIKPQVFQSLSGYFLGKLLVNVVTKDLTQRSQETETEVRSQCQQLADRIIASFEKKFLSTTTRHRDLFRVVSEDLAWFGGEARK